MVRAGPVRRARLRIFQLPRRVPADGGDAFRAPLLAVSGRAIRRLDEAGELHTLPIDSHRGELWYTDGERHLRAWLDGDRHLGVEVRSGELGGALRLVYIPLDKGGKREGRRRYFGRWEYATHRAVLSPKGAGVILEGGSASFEGPPDEIDVARGEGVCLGLRLVPNGVRVDAAEGVEGVEVGAILSEVRVPEVERGPKVEVHPHEAAMTGGPALGFRGSFGGHRFAGFTRTLSDGGGDLARFLRPRGEPSWGAVKAHAAMPADREDHLERALRAEMKPLHTVGRTQVGAAGTIALSDGRKFRVRAASMERLPKGDFELIVAALLEVDEHALELRFCVPSVEGDEPTAATVLKRAEALLVDLVPWRPTSPS
ncbi:MAG: hypothetical protein AB8I08_31200 [Sandaracinaceae bacterium]